MRRMNLSAATVALFLALALPTGLAAQGVTCKDGTTASASGRGACSHHGGVASVALTVSCRDGSTATPGRGACSHHGGVGTATATRTRSSTRIRASKSTTEPSSAETSSGETVSCRDGTTSTAGRGACSHHGGVGAASDRSSTSNATRAEAPNASSETSSTTETPAAREMPTTAIPPQDAPAQASARCNDGTYSQTKHRSGACSHHGGVKQWYKNLPVR